MTARSGPSSSSENEALQREDDRREPLAQREDAAHVVRIPRAGAPDAVCKEPCAALERYRLRRWLRRERPRADTFTYVKLSLHRESP